MASSSESLPSTSLPSGTLKAHSVRLHPGSDLMKSLLDVAERAMASSGSKSAFVLSAVGSLSALTLRLAKSSRERGVEEVNDMRHWTKEKLEVVSLVGTFGPSRQKHLHMSVANGDGDTFGGHLVAGNVFTTLELVIGTIDGVTFGREKDGETGYSELVVTEEPKR